MTTQLEVYNLSLAYLGLRSLNATTDRRTDRRILDTAYTSVLSSCLEQGMWNFAMRATSLTQAGAGSFGFTYVFTKPTDFLRLFSASNNANYNPQLVTDFADLGAQFHANASPLYITYLSNDATSGGLNLTKWTYSFTRFVTLALAANVCLRVTGNEALADKLIALSEIALTRALSVDSVETIPGMLPFNSQARVLPNNDAKAMMDGAANRAPGKLPFQRQPK